MQLALVVHPWCDLEQELADALLRSRLLCSLTQFQALLYAARRPDACPLLLPESHYPVPFEDLCGQEMAFPWPEYPAWSNKWVSA